MLSLWANWLVTKFGLNSLKRYLWPVLYLNSSPDVWYLCPAIQAVIDDESPGPLACPHCPWAIDQHQ